MKLRAPTFSTALADSSTSALGPASGKGDIRKLLTAID